MKRTELTAKTVVELKALARKKNVSLSANYKKADIIEALLSAVTVAKPAVKRAVASGRSAAKKTVVSAKSAAKKTTAPLKAKKAAVSAKSAAKKAAAPLKAKKAAVLAGSAAKKTAAPVPSKTTAARKSVKPIQSSSKKNSAATKRAPVGKRPGAATPVREWKLPPGVEEPLMAQDRIAESKYYTGPAQQASGASYGELPHYYGEEKIVLLTRDPFVAYAYWEVNPARIEHEKAWFGWDSKLVVRIYDITGIQFDGRNAVGFFDQDISEQTGSWYFDVGRPSHSFCADVGLLSSSGSFLTITRSNYVTMPRDGVSDVIDEEWMLVDEEFWKLYGYPEGFKRGISSPEMEEMLKRRREMEITSPGTFSRERPKRK